MAASVPYLRSVDATFLSPALLPRCLPRARGTEAFLPFWSLDVQYLRQSFFRPRASRQTPCSKARERCGLCKFGNASSDATWTWHIYRGGADWLKICVVQVSTELASLKSFAQSPTFKFQLSSLTVCKWRVTTHKSDKLLTRAFHVTRGSD